MHDSIDNLFVEFTDAGVDYILRGGTPNELAFCSQ